MTHDQRSMLAEKIADLPRGRSERKSAYVSLNGKSSQEGSKLT